jgi:hypothetical protein
LGLGKGVESERGLMLMELDFGFSGFDIDMDK